MIKEDLLRKIVKDSYLTKKEASQFVMLALEAIKEALSKGERVTFVGFGSFYVCERKERRGRNPKTGEVLEIPAKRVVKFVPGKALKESIK